jgi:hypothetical protein
MSPHGTRRVSAARLLATIVAVTAISAGAASSGGKASSDQGMLAIAAYNAPWFGREIQLVDLAGTARASTRIRRFRWMLPGRVG